MEQFLNELEQSYRELSYQVENNVYDIYIRNKLGDEINLFKIINEINTHFNSILGIGDLQIFVKNSINIRNIDKDVYIRNVIFNRSIVFIRNNSYDFLKSINFYKCTFKESLLFFNINFKKDIKASECVFYKDINIEKCDFDKLEFTKCIIGDKNKEIADTFNITNSKIKLSDFSNTKFNSKATFHHIMFSKADNNLPKSANFYNTSFNKLVDFYKSEFYADQTFEKTDFLDRAFIGNVVFHKGVKFIYTRVDSNTVISFESSVFKKGIDISRANFLCPIQFWGIEGFDNYDVNKLINDTFYNEDRDEFKTCKRLRESIRYIKHAFRTEGNNIESISFHKLEMSLLKKGTLIHKSYKGKNNILLWGDNASLFLNEKSNKFTTSWLHGICFLLVSSILLHMLISLLYWNHFSVHYKYILEWLRSVIEILNISKWDIKLFGKELTDGAYILLFIGRIFIGYGYYQTVQAFRKYGKN